MLTIERQQAEWEMILTIAGNNNFLTKLITNLKTQTQYKTQGTIVKEKNSNKKWATFTFYSPKIRKCTSLFRQTDIHITFKSTTTIQQYTKPKKHDKNCEYNRSRIYKLSCKKCERSCIGQTSRNLTHRYREHIHYIKNNDPQSAYAEHILQNLHEYRPMVDTMTLLKPIYRTSMLTLYEQLCIQTFHHNDRLVAGQGSGEQNPLYQSAIDTGLMSMTSPVLINTQHEYT